MKPESLQEISASAYSYFSANACITLSALVMRASSPTTAALSTFGSFVLLTVVCLRDIEDRSFGGSYVSQKKICVSVSNLSSLARQGYANLYYKKNTCYKFLNGCNRN